MLAISITSTLQVKKQKLSMTELLAGYHTHSERQSWDSNPNLSPQRLQVFYPALLPWLLLFSL